MSHRIGPAVSAAFVCAGLGLASIAPVRADQAGAAACAGKLDKGARLIYDTAAPKIASSSDPRDLVASETRGLVMAGQLPRARAREAAQAAGRCLVMLRQ
jgi:hypothetical protein